MHFMYANGNASAAQCPYVEKFSNRVFSPKLLKNSSSTPL